MENIKKVLTHYSGIAGMSKGNKNKDEIDIFDLKVMLKQSELKLTKRKIAHLFGISKMTVVEDTTEKGVYKLEHMKLVEFLEFIGRLAILKF